MSYDPTPTPEPLPEQAPFSLSDERRRQINDDLKLPQVGLAVAVNDPPGERLAHLTIVKLPRSSSGRPPRRGVHIPVPPSIAVRLGRESKHRGQQVGDGMFGRKGADTISRKEEFLDETQQTANAIAAERRLQRKERA